MKVIITIPGHGGIDPKTGNYVTKGKRSPKWEDGTQYFEGVGDREVVRYINLILEEQGIKHYTLEGWQDVPLYKRLAYINSIAAMHGVNNCLGLEIHSNGYHDQSVHGWAAYVAKRSGKKTKALASKLFDEMNELFPDERFRKPTRSQKYWTKSLTMTSGTICPYILSENFFHTNKHECKEILMKSEGLISIAKAHVETAKAFINS